MNHLDKITFNGKKYSALLQEIYNNQIKKDGFIGSSGNAYKRIYPDIAEAIENGDNVIIEYIDLD